MTDDIPKDNATAEYFDNHIHDYSPRRFRFALDQIKENADPTSALLDVGCGTGTLLALVQAETGISDLTGMDVSEHALAVADNRITCRTYEASILDADRAPELDRRFDFVVMAAVLHHLVDRSRRESRRLAAVAVSQALGLLADDGRLVIVEPTFTPHWAMSAVFTIKRLVSRWKPERVEIMDKWNNIGAPVVSYYSPNELRELVTQAGADITEEENVEATLRQLPKLLGVTGRWETTLIAQPRDR